MFQQLMHNFFRTNKKKVAIVLFDIDMFYEYVKQNEFVVDDWYFKNIFTLKYWNYLNQYTWLSNNDQLKLHKGILSMILFMSYRFIENSSTINISDWNKISKVVKHYESDNAYINKLHHLVYNAIESIEENKSRTSNNDLSAKVLKSLSWTLKNIILDDKNMKMEYKDKNQR